MFCKKCGKEILDDSLYCNFCGKKQITKEREGKKQRANGQGYAVKRGRTWTAIATVGWKWVDSGKKVRVRKTKGGFRTKKEAIDYLPELRNENRVEKITLESIYKLWERKNLPELSESKQTAYKIAYAKLEDIIRYPVNTLTIEQLQDVVDRKASTYYPARDMKTLLSHLLSRAVAQQLLSVNLAEYIILPQLKEKEQQPFSQEEQNALWEDYASGNWWTGYILLMIYTGMMPGELMGLNKGMIDIDKHIILGAGIKTKKRKEIPLVIASAIEPVLLDLMSREQGERLIVTHEKKFYKMYYETLERCGCRKLPPYSCRHTTASALALQDIPPAVIQKIMRHSKLTTTQRYIHVEVEPMLDAINKIGSGNP